MDTAVVNQNRILCTNLTELVKKTLLSFCEINITFASHLEILGSVHVHADGDDVISFLLNEKCAKTVTCARNGVVHARRSWSDTKGVVKSQSVATEQFLENVVDDGVGRFDEDKVSSSAGREQKVRSSPDVATGIMTENDRDRSDEPSSVRRESKSDLDDDVEIVDARMNVTDGGDGEVAMPIGRQMYSHVSSPEDGGASWMHPWVRPTHIIPNWSAVSNQPRWPSIATHGGGPRRSIGHVRQSSVNAESVDYVPSVVTLQDGCLPLEQLVSAVEVKDVLRSMAGNPDANCGSSSLGDLPPNASMTNIKQELNVAQGPATSLAYDADVETTTASHAASTTAEAAALWGGETGDMTGMWQAPTDETTGIGGDGAGDGETSTIFKHPCFLCSLSFHSQLRLKMHLSRWHRQIVASPGGETRCLICHKVYADAGAFSAHATRCHYRCVACGKSFSSKQAHDLHFRADHQLVRYQCQVCAVRFKTKDGFRCHMNAQHNRSRQYDCLTCGRRFYTRQALYSHKKQNHQ